MERQEVCTSFADYDAYLELQAFEQWQAEQNAQQAIDQEEFHAWLDRVDSFDSFCEQYN